MAKQSCKPSFALPRLLIVTAFLAATSSHAAPLISKLQWGRIRVSGIDSSYRDAKLWPSGSRSWDWRETGTHHRPGVQPADLKELFDKSNGRLDAVVISRGMDLVLQVPEETIRYVKGKGAQVYVLQTEAAVEKYNELVKSGQQVAGLFHSTC